MWVDSSNIPSFRSASFSISRVFDSTFTPCSACRYQSLRFGPWASDNLIKSWRLCFNRLPSLSQRASARTLYILPFAMHPFIHFLLFASAALAAPLFPRAATVTGDGLAFYTSNLNDGSPIKAGSAYTCYSGSADKFPDMDQWASFNDLWTFQVKNALSPIGDTNQEIQAMQQAVVSVSKTAQVDPRVILAVILQESSGNVNVGCTNNGVENCGIMQSHDPADKAFDPSNILGSITQMVSSPYPAYLFPSPQSLHSQANVVLP